MSDLATIAAQIKRLEKRSIGNAIEIGRLLIDARKLLKHGDWQPWLKANFRWSLRTAARYCNLYQLSIEVELSALNISLSALHLLAGSHGDDRKLIIEAAKTRRVTFNIAQSVRRVCDSLVAWMLIATRCLMTSMR